MSTIGNTCYKILQEHIKNQWRWPRESDLVIDLVLEIRNKLDKHLVNAELVSKSSLKSSADPDVCSPRVRTEVKISENKQRVDICLLKSDKPKVLHGTHHGKRDILLSIDKDDVEEILEVKLDPHIKLYWVEDLIKLIEIQKQLTDKKCLHLLAIDNSLELGKLLIKQKSLWQKKVKGVLYKVSQPISQPNLPNWPLKYGQDINIIYGNAHYNFKVVNFQLTNPLNSGIYLWALGITSTTSGVTVAPSCWQLIEPQAEQI